MLNKKILLAAVNARFNQSNPAVRSLARYVRARTPHAVIEIGEWTTAQPLAELLRGIAETEAGMVLFSVYIWNSTLILSAAAELRKLFPRLLIGMGGPEVSYQAENLLGKYPAIDFIIKGEGEVTVAEITAAFYSGETREAFLRSLADIRGIFYRQLSAGTTGQNTVFSGERAPISDLNTLPFIYTDDGTASGRLPAGFDPQTRLAYYESSRGCPFQCSYCLSSLDKSVRYLPLERVLEEIGFFMRHRFRTVKFTDRTFNLDPQRYLAIWRRIGETHNGVTAFHFEIDAQYLCEEAFPVLAALPAGAVQLEIGLQSANPDTLAAIRRRADLQKTAQNIARIPPAVHVHLDLIAGLPHEDFESFKKSFEFASSLRPHMLQLGFLKVLSGTFMEETIRRAGKPYAYLSQPPYEILYTPELPYRDLCRLKDIEHLLDIFYNAGLFRYTLERTGNGLFDFLDEFAAFLRQKNDLYTPRTAADNFAVLHKFILSRGGRTETFTELLRFDFMLLGKAGNFPAWFERRYDRLAHEKALTLMEERAPADEAERHPESAREKFARTAYEEFAFNPLNPELPPQTARFLFVYRKRGESGGRNYSSRSRTAVFECPP